MDHRLINPNLHVILIHYPLGLLIAGIMIELFSFLWRHSSFRVAGRWMILLGALAAIPATFSGVYALKDVARRGNPAGDNSWILVKAASPALSQPAVWQSLRNHALYQSIATGVCVFVVIFWLGCSDRARRSLHVPLMFVLLWGMTMMIVAAWHGGEAVYRYGIGIEPPPKTAAVKASLLSAVEESFPVVELHVIAAGTVFALALLSVGLSIRKITATVELTDKRPIIPRDQTMAASNQRTPPTSVAMARSFNPEIEVMLPPFAPAGRFWLLTLLLAVMTFAGGWYIIASDADVFTTPRPHHQALAQALWGVLMDEIKPSPERSITRPLVHVVTGATLVLVPIIMAALARFAPARRFWSGFFTLILVVAIAAQIWFGILLLYDTPDGPLTHFQTESTAMGK